VELLDVRPDDRVLELGCGHGVAVTLIAERLAAGGGTGTVLGVDRSAKMTAAAATRNAEHVAAGRATFVCTTFEDADFGDQRFDRIFGIHFPPLLRHDPEGTRARVEKLLAPGGKAAWF
jgi:ubiquinone/menaquinone biosynthesis C-methylase UbiE